MKRPGNTEEPSSSRGPGFRLSPERRSEILDAYSEWDPAVESSDELARRLGTTKATLYSIVNKAGIPMRGTRQHGPTDEMYSQAEAMARVALQALLERLEQLSKDCAELTAENEQLKEQLATTQKSLRAAKRA